MKRIAIADAETFIAAIQDEISGTREGRYSHRLHVVLHVLHGSSSYEAAHVYGDSPRSVQSWVHHLLSHGLAGLEEGERSGRPAQLSPSVQERLQSEIRRSPRDLGYDQNLWDGVLLSHHLEEHYATSLGVRQCQRLFHGLGFTLQRPRRQAREADALQQEAFKKTSTNG